MMVFHDHWLWWIAAGLLLIGEMVMPGFFMLWLAMAAALTGLVALLFDPGWQMEVVAFAVAAAALVAASWKPVMRQRHAPSDQPNLNRRHHGYVGRSFTLETAISNGRGKLRIDDTLWDIEGPDMAAGSRVTVAGVQDLRLKVEPSSTH